MGENGRKPGREIGAALSLAARLHRARAGELLGQVGLHPGQERALDILAAGEVAMGDLAVALGVKAPTASKMIARMQQLGLVARVEVAGDARRVKAAITELGRKSLARLPDLAATLEQELTLGLDGRDRKRLRKLLRKLGRNLAPATASEPQDSDAAEA